MIHSVSIYVIHHSPLMGSAHHYHVSRSSKKSEKMDLRIVPVAIFPPADRASLYEPVVLYACDAQRNVLSEQRVNTYTGTSNDTRTNRKSNGKDLD
ncbi:hypothetical protein T07_7113 [Trichinella nelsoni]|uniref:Uncharacterized protein n=1 Tax=Trichinella nelsoni TaxID=6336 RepID=A0A0V0SB37_9BILA|nr:hypothetical protein T07_7113 [Trichinella nelsoni]